MRKPPKLVPVILLLFATCATSQSERNNFTMDGDTLYRRNHVYTVYAVERPDLVMPPFSVDGMVPVINQVAKHGGNSVVFNLTGFNDDGTAIHEPQLNDVLDAIGQLRWRYMGPIVRVIPPEAPSDRAWQLRAAATAGKAFRMYRNAMYLFDQPDSADLVKAFRDAAPGVVVIAREGGNLPLGDAPTDTPNVVMAASVDTIAGDSTHYILTGPDAEQTYDRLLMADVEHEPWTPDNSVLSEAERAEGFIALFDGKSFAGWTIDRDESAWRVRDGMIEWVKRGGGVIRSRDRFDNFILRLEYQISDGGNSGIFVRAPRACRQSKIGFEFQIMGDHGKPTGVHTTGAVYDVLPPAVNANRPAGEWNQVEIRLDGARYTGILNGQTVIDVDFDEHPEMKHRIREGFIGLQDHDHYVAFRNIRLKPL